MRARTGRFVYFLPGMSGISAEGLAQWGLYHLVCTQGCWCVQETDCGPDNNVGCYVCSGGPISIRSDRQVWRRNARFWLSVEDAAAPPEPADLARAVQFDGPRVVLAGSEWKIPRVWKWNAECGAHDTELPGVLYPTPGKVGSLERRVFPGFEELGHVAGRVWAALTGAGSLDGDQAFADAAKLLCQNYHVALAEAEYLELLNAETVAAVLKACVDVPAIEAHAQRVKGG